MKKTLAMLMVLLLAAVAAVPAGIAAEGLDYDADIVIWLPGNGSVPGYEEGASENDNRFINAIREATGYKNLTAYVMPATDPVTQMNLLLSSGDYPDAIYVNSLRQFYLDYLNQGFWAPVDEAVAAYGPAIEAQMNAAVWATAELNGVHYAIPVPRHTSYEGKFLGDGVMYRADILAEMNLEAPATYEGFYELLKAVKEAYPDMTAYSNANINSNWFRAVFGMWAQYGLEDGTVVSNYDLYVKDYLAFMSKLYAEGLLDPESAYQTASQRNEKIIAGNVFAWDDGVWSKQYRQSWAETGTNNEIAFFPNFENVDGTKGMADAFASANMWMFPVTSTHINEVVDLINTFLNDAELETFINYGVEGEHYTVDDQGTYHTMDGYEAVIYKIYYRLWFKADVWWNNAVLGDFVPEIEKWYDATHGFDNINLFSYMPTSDAQVEYQSTVDDIFDEYTAKIITGELPIDAADEMLAKMHANGYDEIIQSVQDWYDAAGAVLAGNLGI